MSSATAEQPTLVADAPPAGEPAGAGARSRVALAWRDLLYLLTALPAGIVTFSTLVTGWSTSFSLLITVIGIPVAMITIALTRAMAWVERRRAAIVLGEPVPERYRARLPTRAEDWRSIGVAWQRWKAVLSDPQLWKDTLYELVLLPAGIAAFTIAVTAWSLVIALVTLPAWWWIPPVDDSTFSGVSFDVTSWPVAIAGMVAGLLLVPVAYGLCRGAALACAALASALLGPGAKELEERVERLEETRAGAVDAARLELERIERDLHDGAQARLVAAAMSLGLAEQRLAAGDGEGGGALVREAREETQRALAELRDLARGIRPALLSERGLHEAIVSLTARSGGVPVTVDYAVDGPLPAAVETAAYFVAAEALANVRKHAGATSAAVRVERRGERLEVEVRDDGRGGADPAGGGLTGLRRRVEALDGALLISSPQGGPTVLRAELPCAS
jgi:signal transduction histidine kinase